MSMGVYIKNRHSAGSCLTCRQPDDQHLVVEISLSSVLVRVCPDCADKLRAELGNAISRLDMRKD